MTERDTREKTAEAEPSQVPELDTREKLEEDIVAAIKRTSGIRRDEIFGWLDRQAAITEHNLMANECDNCEPMHEAECRIRELTAFSNRVFEAVNEGNDLTLFGVNYVPEDAYYSALNAADAIAQRAVALRDEVNQLRKVVRTQAESFAKLERELAMAKEEQ